MNELVNNSKEISAEVLETTHNAQAVWKAEPCSVDIDGKLSKQLVETSNEIATDNSMFSAIDESEFDTDYCPKTYKNVSLAIQNGALRPQDMLAIELLEDGITGLYAKRVNESSGKSYVALVYYRSDGTCTEDIKLENKDLVPLVFSTMEGASQECIKEAKKPYNRIQNKILEYWDGTVIFDIAEVIKKLAANLNQLPVDSTQCPDVNFVYTKVVEFVDKYWGGPEQVNFFRRGFYAFHPMYFKDLAESVQMEPKKLAEFLKRNHLLYLQDSGHAFQCKVRDIGNCYCVRVIKDLEREIPKLAKANISDL